MLRRRMLAQGVTPPQVPMTHLMHPRALVLQRPAATQHRSLQTTP